MADQFDSTDIFISVGNVPQSAPLIFSERPIPGGTDVYVDISNSQLERITLDLFFKTLSDYNVIKAKKGVTGALNTTTFGNYAAALLINVSQADVAPMGERHATCEFLIT